MRIARNTIIISLMLLSVSVTAYGQGVVKRQQQSKPATQKSTGTVKKNPQVTVTSGEYVDLGLPSGTLWATKNIGANKPEEYGDYFSWGAIRGYKSGIKNFRKEYPWFKNGLSNQIIKYNNDSKKGQVDNKIELDLEDDVANVKKGKLWRIPSSDQFQELMDYCTWKWTRYHGVNGCIIKGSNGNSIFLPAGGVRTGECHSSIGSDSYYWSRSLSKKYSSCALCCNFDSDIPKWLNSDGGVDRDCAMNIRPVRIKE